MEELKHKNSRDLAWRVNTSGLLKEVLNNPTTHILAKPIQIFADLLFKVGIEASRINDKELNKLMCRLAIYEVCDPYSKNFDQKIVDEILNQ